jgi:hypothetical protein
MEISSFTDQKIETPEKTRKGRISQFLFKVSMNSDRRLFFLKSQIVTTASRSQTIVTSRTSTGTSQNA